MFKHLCHGSFRGAVRAGLIMSLPWMVLLALLSCAHGFKLFSASGDTATPTAAQVFRYGNALCDADSLHACTTVDNFGADFMFCQLPTFLGGVLEPAALLGGASATLLTTSGSTHNPTPVGPAQGEATGVQVGTVTAFGLHGSLVVTVTAECGWLLLGPPSLHFDNGMEAGEVDIGSDVSVDGSDRSSSDGKVAAEATEKLYSCGSTSVPLSRGAQQRLLSTGKAAPPPLGFTVTVRIARFGGDDSTGGCTAFGPELVLTQRLELRAPTLPETGFQRLSVGSGASGASSGGAWLGTVPADSFDLVTTASMQVRLGEEEQLVVRQLRASGDVLDANVEAYNVSYSLAGLQLPSTPVTLAAQQAEEENVTAVGRSVVRCLAAVKGQAAALAAALALPVGNVSVTCASEAERQGLMQLRVRQQQEQHQQQQGTAGAVMATASPMSALMTAAALCPGGLQQHQQEEDVALVSVSFLISSDADPRVFAAAVRKLLAPQQQQQQQQQQLQKAQQTVSLFLCDTDRTESGGITAAAAVALGVNSGSSNVSSSPGNNTGSGTGSGTATDLDFGNVDVMSVLALRMRVDVTGGRWSVGAGGALQVRSGGPPAATAGTAAAADPVSVSGTGGGGMGMVLEMRLERVEQAPEEGGGEDGPQGSGRAPPDGSGIGAGPAVPGPARNSGPGGGGGGGGDSTVSKQLLGAVAGASAAATLLLGAVVVLLVRRYKSYRTQLYLGLIGKPLSLSLTPDRCTLSRSRGGSSGSSGGGGGGGGPGGDAPLSRTSSATSTAFSPVVTQATVAFTLGSEQQQLQQQQPFSAVQSIYQPRPMPLCTQPAGSLSPQSTFMASALRRLISSCASLPSVGDLQWDGERDGGAGGSVRESGGGGGGGDGASGNLDPVLDFGALVAGWRGSGGGAGPLVPTTTITLGPELTVAPGPAVAAAAAAP